MSKKFALIGSARVGKTAIFEKLKEILPKGSKHTNEVAFIKEAARDLILTFAPKTHFSYNFQVKILAEILKREKKVENYPLIICDRSVVDAVVYCQALGFEKGTKKLYQKVKNWLPTYTRFFLLDIASIPLEKDKIRTDWLELRKKTHQLFLEFLEKESLPYKLITGSEKERLKKILKEIKSE